MVSPFQVVLDDVDRVELERRVRAGNTAQKVVLRAVIVLLAADGESNAAIADELGICVDTARKWRARFCAKGIKGLVDAPRSGRPPVYTPTEVTRVKAWACELPAEHGLPLSRWSAPELARQLLIDGIGVSASTVRRWLAQDALKPWQHQSWIFIRDPRFEAKASVVLDLYARTYQGVSLGADEYVISADEKPSIQARRRCHDTQPAGKGRPMRVNHDYRRGGALAYLAAYDVHHARVFGRCEQSTGIVPFTALVDQVMAQEPYASAHRVFWIVDNGSSHRGRAAVDRLSARYPNAVMVHTPVHASWLNQVEIFFSIIQRKVLSPNNFEDLTAVERRLLAFEERYNATAAPFKWRYTTADLHRHLDRLDHHYRTLQAA
ncbi:IS630 family transposase [Rhodococcus opacus]|uniref:IS630 family transposase n=1 Tax=Rhodococcus opacus TaxID=37919 RepID=UPI000EA93602|nr:IS630 family transposase [Rhodococcus opacus]QZS52994.1 IS630 family transposase [Rhodococcus opacus]RKM65336.1 IS630 family transposase [Rhodococcus opacus]